MRLKLSAKMEAL